ncbi:hypothetical protein [Hydrogenophaga sp. MI9]|uniref:hypothetical protein n=1 Tax=Hydrogenophaga sp. MI9 TaxID=3453719 RepID=UPI003EEC3F54
MKLAPASWGKPLISNVNPREITFMSNRSYEAAADEFDALGFFAMVQEFASSFAELSVGELMAMRSRFVCMAAGEGVDNPDERQTSYLLSEALDEVIVYRLRGNEAGLQTYLNAKEAELERLRHGDT